jgi:archaemetzincin
MILVKPIGEVEEVFLQGVLAGVNRVFGFPAVLGSQLALEPEMSDVQRGQYSSAAMLKALADRPDRAATRILGVAGVDLFIPMLSFVFGQAQVGGKLAVISVSRLRQEFYGVPPQVQRTVSRCVKESVHELGHTFGLLHCRDTRCPMSLSNTLQHVDAKGEELCSSCSRLLDDYIIHNGLSLSEGQRAESER